MRVGVSPGVGLQGWLRCFAHPLGGVLCRRHVQYPAFAPDTLFLLQVLQKGQLGFLVFLCLLVQNLPQLHVHAVIFSPIQFLCILLLEEMFVQVQALQHCSKGSQVPGLSQYNQSNEYKNSSD